jgi:hypothetical protein
VSTCINIFLCGLLNPSVVDTRLFRTGIEVMGGLCGRNRWTVLEKPGLSLV